MCCHGNKVHGWYHITRVAHWRKAFLKLAYSSLFFFSKDDNGTSNFADFLTNMCISNCVKSFFFWTFVIVTYCQIDIFDKYVGGHLSLAYNNNYRWTWIQILACEWFFFPLSSSILLLFVFVFFLFLLVFIVYHTSWTYQTTNAKKCWTSHYSKSCEEMQYWRETRQLAIHFSPFLKYRLIFDSVLFYLFIVHVYVVVQI